MCDSLRAFIMRRLRFAIVLLATGCAGYWGRRPLDQPTPVQRHDPVWIWSGGEVKKWHSVVITQDSISGIPYQMPVWCGSCRLSIPRARVDSMKLGYKTGFEKLTKHAAEGVGILTAFILIDGVVCYLLDRGDPQC